MKKFMVMKYHILSAIGTLMYLPDCTRPDIAFTVNLLARYSSTPIKRHWNEVKNIFCYLCGTTKMRLFYCESNSQLIGYADYPTKGDHKQVIYSPMAVLQFLRNLSNKH